MSSTRKRAPNKTRRPTDATMRNVRAWRKDLRKLEVAITLRLVDVDKHLLTLADRVRALEDAQGKGHL